MKSGRRIGQSGRKELLANVDREWGYRRAVAKRADSKHRGCEFESSTCQNKSTIGEEKQLETIS